MPKLMKGATPSKLVKGVTATRIRNNTVSSLRQLRILIAKHNATDFTSLSIPSPNGRGSSLENRSSQHRGYC
ncbi:hypothetical protein T4D_5190 [Trichinella pseudospiralis]|uniref:Uncharacterized protein n=1 Tax=Trichinella pseudospiralis TaxID=6337 RepID=A0A0V1DQU5_TRIPS|nr:hypothetical protein T4D_5190 [Trichinella pseudospiralis]